MTQSIDKHDNNQDEIFNLIKEQINNHPILLYMKGTPEKPECGFSSRAVNILKSLGVSFFSINILEPGVNQAIRKYLPIYANYPTFPQLWVKEDLIGGSDIMLELYESGELEEKLNNLN